MGADTTPAAPARRLIFVVSGGEGTSGEQLVLTALAQFEGADVEVEVVPRVRRRSQVDRVVRRASECGGTIVHTLVDAELRRALVARARACSVVAIDPMGRILSRLSAVLGRRPVGRPGLYRQLHEEYFERVQAMDFTVAHDDGRHPEELPEADVVIIGVSRVGKTPLSMYLALLGQRAANLPIVPGVDPPASLDAVDARRVVGLTISPTQLARHRRDRAQRLRMEDTDYVDARTMRDEQQAVRRLCRRRGFALLDVTDRPIEDTADEVLALVGRRLDAPAD